MKDKIADTENFMAILIRRKQWNTNGLLEECMKNIAPCELHSYRRGKKIPTAKTSDDFTRNQELVLVCVKVSN